jgi:DHA2 family multidrug resistance protein
LRPDENNNASSLTNLFRSWDGSLGIAFVTAATERRENFHQSILGSSLDPTSQVLQQGTFPLIRQLIHHGFSGADAGSASIGIIYEQLIRQSLALAYMDCFRVFAWLNLLAIPLIFAIRTFKPQEQATTVH